MYNKFNIVRVNLDPTVGSEINKTRPCLIISPDEMNGALRTVIVAPLTSTAPRSLPTRILIRPSAVNRLKNDSYAVLDQIKTIDKTRIMANLGRISSSERVAVTDALLALFDL